MLLAAALVLRTMKIELSTNFVDFKRAINSKENAFRAAKFRLFNLLEGYYPSARESARLGGVDGATGTL